MRSFVLGIAAVIFSCTLSGQLLASAEQYSPTDKALTLNVEWRLRYENKACTDFRSTNQKDPQDELSRIRLDLIATASPQAKVVARLQHSYRRTRLYGSADTQERSGFHQLYLDTTWDNITLRLGRQEMGYGDYRLLILSNWDNIGYTWDALLLRLRSPRWQTDVFYGRPGMFPTNTARPTLYGVYAVYKPSARWQSDLYLLRKESNISGSSQQVWAIGARPTIQLSKRTRSTAEAVLQWGKSGTKDLQAWGYWVRLEYALPRVRNAKLILQRDFASGGNPDDATLHTFDQFFGTTFGTCGRLGLQGWRNMSTWRLGIWGSPSQRWQYTADIHLNRLANAHDYWYSGGGTPVKGSDGKLLHDPTGAAGTEVGTEVNFTINYSLTPSLQLSAGYGRFMPGRFVRQVNGGSADPTEWFYLQTTRRF